MASRMGVNRRKKKKEQRRKRRSFLSNIGIFLLLTAVAVAGAGMLYHKYRDRIDRLASYLESLRNPTIENVVVRGTLQISPDELLRRSGVSFPLSLKKFKQEYLNVLETVDPFIEKVRLIKTRGTTVTISVQERQPMAFLAMDNLWLVDRQGVCIPLDRNVAYDLPLVSGLDHTIGKDSVRQLKKGEAERLGRFLDQVQQFDTSFARSVSQIHFGEDRLVTLMFISSPAVVIMRDDDVPGSCTRLSRIWTIVGGDAAKLRKIDLSFRNLAYIAPAVGKTVAAVRNTNHRPNEG
ncbi:MAG: hypothetical protein JW768_15920 [Chitinispirillaceae bacterium]|nr:hypothetical protein [Chitinispirillaceae bacterium]